MSLDDFPGPRMIKVSVIGWDVFACRHNILDTGHGKSPGLPIYDLPIGKKSDIPFDNNVYDIAGRKIGEIESIVPDYWLKRW